jgi:hypothetical protein
MPRGPSAIGRPVAPVATVLALLCGLFCVLLGTDACVSPTLPLPPPEAPMQTEGVDAAHIKLSAGCGGAQDGAEIIIVNQTLELSVPDQAIGGSFASECGAWDAQVLAKTGDVLAITQESGTLASGATIYNVR